MEKVPTEQAEWVKSYSEKYTGVGAGPSTRIIAAGLNSELPGKTLAEFTEIFLKWLQLRSMKEAPVFSM